MQIPSPSIRWLANAALHHIQESPTSDATRGTLALSALLSGTPAGEEAERLHSLTEQQAASARKVMASLDHETPRFP